MVMNSKGYDAENLQMLATFLAYTPSDVQFDMNKYSPYGPGDSFSSRWHRGCGSVGCAVGHATLIWPKPWRMTFTDYSAKMFFAKSHQSVNFQWLWAFAQEWAKVDNTPLGAAKRIQYFLDHNGKLPLDWNYDDSIALYRGVEVKTDRLTERKDSTALIVELKAKIKKEIETVKV